ncbi:LuxR family transcriptional regulator, partial [Gordonibacter sp.]|uniref:LuxR family transcriptional regulator n=1 Tax=Gordonibacter sp. TaxID=1968902 RepID=UPI002FC8B067
MPVRACDAGAGGRWLEATVRAFLEKLVKACPALPYMSLGLWLAWAYIAYSGTAWLSDTETNGQNISILYVVSTVAFAVALLASTFAAPEAKRLLSKPAWIVGGGVLASLGCIFIIVIGPYYLSTVIPQEVVKVLFWIGGGMSGAGTAVFGLKCGELYGSLPPRKVVLYAALSHIVLAFVYFVAIGAPTWGPIPGGPSFVGILVFVGMPLLTSLAAALFFLLPKKSVPIRPYAESRSRLSRPFWKLVAVTFVFSVIVVALRSALVEISPVEVTLDNTRLVMLLRILMAVVFACAAVGIEADRFNFGKIYSVIMAAVVALIAFCPIVGVMHLLWSQIITFLSCVFEFVLWCILAFIVYQKRISPILVFGYGYGAFMLGSGIGWALGIQGFSQ